ncbi:hypothetical protein LSAT2_026549 [Lamellibrachia satsuma]|nr:hypothetical protein LSAT2_026549 [Lamellibrachia satsuma]
MLSGRVVCCLGMSYVVWAGCFVASFRGRPLKGEKLNAPPGYTGVVMHEGQSDGGEDRTIRVTHTFKDFTYWNLDVRPSVNDKIVQVMDWVDLAKVIHRPVDEDSSQRSVVGK